MKTNQTEGGESPAETASEPHNVAVIVLENRTKIRGAICASGRCDFPLTATEAKALEALGKVKIEGLF